MQIFLDTANIDEIRQAHAWGVIDGVTTNPSLIAKNGKDFIQTIFEIVVSVSRFPQRFIISGDLRDDLLPTGACISTVLEEHMLS